MNTPKNKAALMIENRTLKAVVLAALLASTALACNVSDLLATASSDASSSAPSLQGTWLWKSDRTPADAQAQAFVGSKSYFHVLCEGDSVVRVQVPQEAVTLTRAAADSYPEEGLLSILGACAGFDCVVVLLGLGAFVLVRSLNHRRA